MKRLAATALIFMLAASVAHSGEGIKEGEPPPMFTLTDDNDQKVELESILTKPTIMYFTHNACYYCTQIIAYLKRAEKKFGREKLQIIGVNVMAKDQKLIKAYKRELEFTFPMFAGNREDVLRAYKINYVPLIIFVDSKKTVRKVVGHYIHEPELHKNITEIMK
ncbi:MAG: TlpA family protein disulfide reductase [Nitrospiraceae bacterium]|nr:MAG: TlpA family protein disulfide reductase [Nitrospiraceae bacterium]